MLTVTADQVRRRLIFDSMADPERACSLVGMVGVSDEGRVKETEESHRRLGMVGPLIPGLMTVAEWTAEVATSINVSNLDFDPPEEFVLQMQQMLTTVLQGGLVAAFSVFNDLGMISVTLEDE